MTMKMAAVTVFTLLFMSIRIELKNLNEAISQPLAYITSQLLLYIEFLIISVCK